jgi:heme-degrading monooxygenase HmoA
MITSVAMLTAQLGHEAKVIEILNEFVAQEKKVPGCVRVYFKQALDTRDTFFVYSEYDTLEHFRASDQAVDPPKEGKIQFRLKPHIVKAFFGNFE